MSLRRHRLTILPSLTPLRVTHPPKAFELRLMTYLKNFLVLFLRSFLLNSFPLETYNMLLALLSSQLPNLPHYRLNPTEQVKLNRQVHELFSKLLFVISWVLMRSLSTLPLRRLDFGGWVLILEPSLRKQWNIGFSFWGERICLTVLLRLPGSPG